MSYALIWAIFRVAILWLVSVTVARCVDVLLAIVGPLLSERKMDISYRPAPGDIAVFKRTQRTDEEWWDRRFVIEAINLDGSFRGMTPDGAMVVGFWNDERFGLATKYQFITLPEGYYEAITDV